MENVVNTLDVIHEICASVARANDYLRENPADRFNRMMLGVIDQEIESAKLAASHWKYMNPGTHEYTHIAPFPVAFYNVMGKDFIDQLEKTSGICIYEDAYKNAFIKIVLHF